MQRSNAFWGMLLVTVALAGCAGSDDTLGIQVTPGADPVTDAYKFKATGSADHFEWDLGDGTMMEGREVEHIFGFTNGEVTVRLTAHVGETEETVSQVVNLGGNPNTLPDVVMEGSSIWVEPGDEITFSAAASTDPDGDPLLYRWTCYNRGPALPSHGDDHGTGGLPFGVNALGTVSANISETGKAIDGDLCLGLDNTFSRDGTITGSFAEAAVYNIDVHVRDPKSVAKVGRMTIFVTPGIPEPTESLPLTGTLTFGSGGNVQTVMDQTTNPTGISWDVDEQNFRLTLPIKSATLSFDISSEVPGASATYEIKAGGSAFVAPTSEATKTFGYHELLQGVRYDVVFMLDQGAEVDFTWTLDVEYDMVPTVLWEAPI